MDRVKTDRRNRLGSITVDNLMRISLDGPPCSEYSSKKAAEVFFRTKVRKPNNHSYRGDKKEDSPTVSEDADSDSQEDGDFEDPGWMGRGVDDPELVPVDMSEEDDDVEQGGVPESIADEYSDNEMEEEDDSDF